MKWLYSSIFFTMLSVSFSISGCGADADESCAYQVERDIDQGDYDAVITALDNNGTCNGALSQDAAWTNLAAAYLGKAGITLSNIVGSVLDSNATDPMAAMLESFAASATSASLQSMNSAGKVYAYIRTAQGYPDCNSTAGAPATVVDSCFYDGITNSVQTASIMSLAMGDGVEFLSTPVVGGSIDDVNDNNTSDALEVTGCAMAQVADVNNTCTSPVDGSITFLTYSDVNFTDGTVLKPRFFNVEDLTPDDGNQSYYQMLNASSPVSTTGVCGLDYQTSASCSTDTDVNYTSGCYPCPIIIDGAEIESTTVLVDSINNGEVTGVTASTIEAVCAPPAGTCVEDGTLTSAELAEYMTLF